MLQITTKIVLPSTKRFATYSFTEKIYFLSWLCVIPLPFLLMADLASSKFTGFLGLSALILTIIGTTGPLFETEPLYGKFTEDITITEKGITYRDTFYPFHSIQDFKVEMKSFYRQRTGKSRSGPKYFRGINNHIFFISDNTIVHEYFLISSGTEFEELQTIINRAIVKEMLPFRHSYLDMVSENYKQTEEYHQFVRKIKQKNHTFVS